MKVTVKIEGIDRLMSKLRDVMKTKARKAVRKGSRPAAKIVAAKAKDLVPVDTGELKKVIKVRALPKSRKWAGAMATVKVEGGPTYYGGFVELGTKKMRARHFMRRAAELSRAAASRAFVEGMAEELNKP